MRIVLGALIHTQKQISSFVIVDCVMILIKNLINNVAKQIYQVYAYMIRLFFLTCQHVSKK